MNKLLDSIQSSNFVPHKARILVEFHSRRESEPVKLEQDLYQLMLIFDKHFPSLFPATRVMGKVHTQVSLLVQFIARAKAKYFHFLFCYYYIFSVRRTFPNVVYTVVNALSEISKFSGSTPFWIKPLSSLYNFFPSLWTNFEGFPRKLNMDLYQSTFFLQLVSLKITDLCFSIHAKAS